MCFKRNVYIRSIFLGIETVEMWQALSQSSFFVMFLQVFRVPEQCMHWVFIFNFSSGSVFVPLPFELGMKELSRRLLAVKPSCIVTWSGYLEKLHDEITVVRNFISYFSQKLGKKMIHSVVNWLDFFFLSSVARLCHRYLASSLKSWLAAAVTWS